MLYQSEDAHRGLSGESCTFVTDNGFWNQRFLNPVNLIFLFWKTDHLFHFFKPVLSFKNGFQPFCASPSSLSALQKSLVFQFNSPDLLKYRDNLETASFHRPQPCCEPAEQPARVLSGCFNWRSRPGRPGEIWWEKHGCNQGVDRLHGEKTQQGKVQLLWCNI